MDQPYKNSKNKLFTMTESSGIYKIRKHAADEERQQEVSRTRLHLNCLEN